MSDPCASFLDSDGCVVVPECPADPGTPAHIEQAPAFGWGTGANSIAEQDGDLFTRFDMPVGVLGVYIGFRAPRRLLPHLPIFITHGFYFERSTNDVVSVAEAAQQITAPVARGANDVFEIRRVSNVVTYWINGVLVHESAVRSFGPLVVNACLYASNDEVPSGAPAGSLVALFNPQSQGVLALDTPTAAATNPANDGLHDWFWEIDVPADADSLTVTLTDNAGNEFAAADGALVVGPMPAVDALNNPQATATSSPFTATVNSLSSLKYYAMLRCPEGITGLSLSASAHIPSGGGGGATLNPNDQAQFFTPYTYAPTADGDASGFFLDIESGTTSFTVQITDDTGYFANNGGTVNVQDENFNPQSPFVYQSGNTINYQYTVPSGQVFPANWMIQVTELTPAGVVNLQVVQP